MCKIEQNDIRLQGSSASKESGKIHGLTTHLYSWFACQQTSNGRANHFGIIRDQYTDRHKPS